MFVSFMFTIDLLIFMLFAVVLMLLLLLLLLVSAAMCARFVYRILSLVPVAAWPTRKEHVLLSNEEKSGLSAMQKIQGCGQIL